MKACKAPSREGDRGGGERVGLSGGECSIDFGYGEVHVPFWDGFG